MKTLNLVQGSPEWLAFRREHDTASEAPAMMGASPYVTRAELLRLKATGDEQQFDSETLQRFADGHEVERRARLIAERIIGEELFPATGCEDTGKFSASFDGITLLEDTIWECKQWNEAKAARVLLGELPIEDKWQVVQQLIVSGAKTCLYIVTDGTEDKLAYMWVTLDPADESALRAGWALFNEDLANYVPTDEPAKVIGRAPETLPALSITVQGGVTASNLSSFKATALNVFDHINTDLQTDEDFADAETTAKWCKDVEGRLDSTIESVLGQMVSVDEVVRTLKDLKARGREVRLQLENAVKDRKKAIRGEILAEAQGAFASHMAALNASLPMHVLSVANTGQPDFAGVMSGKKTVKSLRAAVDQELARVKLAGNDTAERVRANFKRLDELSKGHETLFADRSQLVFKAADDLEAVVKQRITEDRARIDREAEAKAEAERGRIRQEEADKLRKAEQERLAREHEQEAASKAATPAQVAAPAAAPQPIQQSPTPAPVAAPTPAQTVRDALWQWKLTNEIDDGAYSELLQVLNTYRLLPARAA
ncbi:MAG TPA: YqaJ viral recombinase family protein [Rhodanobacter sp.]|nr:YqaJ viral recombinase family protein [Rhodanobacter sp.]